MNTRPFILLWQPFDGRLSQGAIEAFNMGFFPTHNGITTHNIMGFQPFHSLLCVGFNAGVAAAKNEGVEYFALLHADLAPQGQWLKQLLDDAREYDLDIIHAPAAIKDGRGVTSTAMAYTTDKWAPKRRLTIKELAKLPEVFTIDDVRERIDSRAQVLLPNTGCLLMRCGEWFQTWQGFCFDDIVAINEEGRHVASFVPEDWNLGFDAHASGIRVGATTRVKTLHTGYAQYPCHGNIGEEVDPNYLKFAHTLEESAA